MINKKYCMSSFLMFRRVSDKNKRFCASLSPKTLDIGLNRIPINSSDELYETLKQQVEVATSDGKAALALSGGIDSAILAKFMPKGSVAYTFKCIVPGLKVTDETQAAAKYAKECGLEHRIIEIFWEDFIKYAPSLMLHKGAPIHSIEVQIYKAALRAKEDGYKRVIYGESADSIFGGLSNLLSQEWRVGDFIERYSYVLPYKVLKKSELVLEPYLRHVKDGYVDPHEFLSTEFFSESVASYINASETANMGIVLPYSNCYMNIPLDYKRVRAGENKYLVRNIFNKLYKDFEVPEKTPMPRPTNEWLKDWEGPKREEFWPHSADNMTGDQKWLIFALEMFLNLIENYE